jgi:hypothetical protein
MPDPIEVSLDLTNPDHLILYRLFHEAFIIRAQISGLQARLDQLGVAIDKKRDEIAEKDEL